MKIICHLRNGRGDYVAENDISRMPTFWGMFISRVYISEEGGPDICKNGKSKSGFFSILRIKNKRFYLKNFHLSAHKTVL
jgi:hypothetical protein